MVDRVAKYHHEVAPARRARRSGVVKSCDPRLFERSAPFSAQFGTRHKCALDLFHEETAADCEKPGNTNLENNPAGRWRARVTSSVPHRCSLDGSSIRWERTAFGQRSTQPH